jgi:hypothetical protein
MADEQSALQKGLHDVPRWEVRAHIELMEQQAIKLSRLAALLDREGHEEDVSIAQNRSVSSTSANGTSNLPRVASQKR